MRRLLILLLAMVAFGAFVPATPTFAAPSHHGHMMPAGGCHDEGQCIAHICLGCAMTPAEPPAPPPSPPRVTLSPVAASPRFIVDHRPGFDPPPPRRLG